MNKRFKYFLGLGFALIAFLSINLLLQKNDYTISSKVSKNITPLKSLVLPAVNELPPIPQKKTKAENILINARQYLLMDADTKYKMVGKDELKPVPIASLTKLMTTLVVIESENYKPDKIVTISKKASQTPGSSTILHEGEKLKLEDLIKAMLINSTNSAAVALAEDFSGSEEAFVAKMNAVAKQLKMNKTHFNDSAGLNDEGRSCAFDIARLGAELFKNETIKSIAQISETTITSIDGKYSHKLKNSNRLVTDEMHFDGIIGGKTGFTPVAGHSLLSVANRNNHTLVAVVINTFSGAKSASAKETGKLLKYGFSAFSWN